MLKTHSVYYSHISLLGHPLHPYIKMSMSRPIDTDAFVPAPKRKNCDAVLCQVHLRPLDLSIAVKAYLYVAIDKDTARSFEVFICQFVHCVKCMRQIKGGEKFAMLGIEKFIHLDCGSATGLTQLVKCHCHQILQSPCNTMRVMIIGGCSDIGRRWLCTTSNCALCNQKIINRDKVWIDQEKYYHVRCLQNCYKCKDPVVKSFSIDVVSCVSCSKSCNKCGIDITKLSKRVACTDEKYYCADCSKTKDGIAPSMKIYCDSEKCKDQHHCLEFRNITTETGKKTTALFCGDVVCSCCKRELSYCGDKYYVHGKVICDDKGCRPDKCTMCNKFCVRENIMEHKVGGKNKSFCKECSVNYYSDSETEDYSD